MSKNKEGLSLEIFRPALKRIIPIKPRINIGGKFDHYNGQWFTGKYGESILNGGLSLFCGVSGKQNRFKTALARGIGSIAFSRMRWLNDFMPDKAFVTYTAIDAEFQTEEKRWHDMLSNPWYEFGQEPFDNGEWRLSDTAVQTFNVVFEKYAESARAKRDNYKAISVEWPFLDRDNKPIQMPWPSFLDLDTISQVRTETQADINLENDISSNKRNMSHIHGAREKSGVIDDIPPLAVGTNSYFISVAQIKESHSLDGKPIEKLFADLTQGLKIGNVPQNYHYLLLDHYAILKAERLMQSDPNKGPKWPRKNEMREKANTDLNRMIAFNLRGKSGISGLPIRFVCSQSEGYLPYLTMWDDIYDAGYGILGGRDTYSIAFLPELELTRNTVRTIINENADFRRALELQSSLYYEEIVDSVCFRLGELLPKNPTVLYEAIKKDYDWNNVILKTRSWYTPLNDKHPVPYLSIMDLMKMRLGQYVPYWYKKKG